MARIEFEAFVEPWTRTRDEHPAWGMKTAEAHRRKNDAGTYETVARTFRTVKVSRDSGIDLTGWRTGDRVKVSGTELTESREHDGKTYYDLVVWADSVEGTRDHRQPVNEAPSWSTEPVGGGVDDYASDTPF